MTETYFPFDAGAGSSVQEAQWREMARNWRGSGVFSGVLDALEVYGDSSGMQVKLKTGEAWVDGFKYKNSAEMTLAISAAHATLGRIDRIILRLDISNNTLTVVVLAGTPAASPAAPALTQSLTGTYEISLAKITVGAAVSTITSGNVTDERTYSLATFNSPLATEYDSGWFAVAYGNTYTFAHGLGGAPKLAIVEWCSTNAPTPSTKIYVVLSVFSASNVMVTTLAFDDTNIYASAGTQTTAGTKYASDGTQSAAGFWRVRAWK